jgi:hypothetical protein
MHVPPVLQQGDANRANQVLSWQVLDVDAGRGYGTENAGSSSSSLGAGEVARHRTSWSENDGERTSATVSMKGMVMLAPTQGSTQLEYAYRGIEAHLDTSANPGHDRH